MQAHRPTQAAGWGTWNWQLAASGEESARLVAPGAPAGEPWESQAGCSTLLSGQAWLLGLLLPSLRLACCHAAAAGTLWLHLQLELSAGWEDAALQAVLALRALPEAECGPSALGTAACEVRCWTPACAAKGASLLAKELHCLRWRGPAPRWQRGLRLLSCWHAFARLGSCLRHEGRHSYSWLQHRRQSAPAGLLSNLGRMFYLLEGLLLQQPAAWARPEQQQRQVAGWQAA